MKVKIVKTGEVKTVNDSYGLRLIEQGKAVSVSERQKKPAKKEAAKAGDA